MNSDLIQTLKVTLEAQVEQLQKESQAREDGWNQVTAQLKNKDDIITKKCAKVKCLQEEISRRQFMEAKVQTYVKTLCG